MKYGMLLFLNIFDGVATCLGMRLGHLSEANPILAHLSPIGILAVKLILVNFLILVLFSQQENKLSRIGTLVVLGVYVHIYVLHLSWIGTVI